MKSKVCKVNGKLFRYDYDNSVVEYVYKLSDEEIQDELDWMEKHNGKPLVGMDEDGFSVVESVGLRRENWENKEARMEYLNVWADELDEEAAYLMDSFIKYELPYLKGE